MKSIIIDKRGQKIAEVPYSAFDFSGGRAMISTVGANNRYGFINTAGEVIIPVIYAAASSFSNGRARVKDDKGKSGFVDQNGQMVIPAVYSEVGPFYEGLAAVRTDDGWAYINPAGEIVISPIAHWKKVPHFSCGRAPFQADDNKWGYIDLKGAKVIPAQFVDYDYFSEDLCIAWLGESAGFIDLAGNWHIQPILKRVDRFSHGLAAAYQGAQVYFIDTHGDTRFDLNAIGQGLQVDSFREGLCSFKKDGKWGFINLEGRVVIEPIYTSFIPPHFSEGLAAVEKDGKLLYIDQTGKVELELGSGLSGGNFSEGLTCINAG